MSRRATAERERRWSAERGAARRWQFDQWRKQRQRLAENEAGIARDEAWRTELEATVAKLSAQRRPRVGEPVGRRPSSPRLARPFLPGDPARPQFEYRAASPAVAPLVSIVTPFFNAGERFYATAASVRAQSLPAWEWIVVDDASTDARSVEILAELVAAEPRMRSFRRPTNGGPGAARNDGFARARAPYLLQLDADDLLEPTAAEKWLWYLETHDEASFVNGHTVCFGALEGLWTRGFEAGASFLERNFVGGRGMLRRATVDAVGGYDPKLPLALEDWDFWLRCAGAGLWGATLDEPLDWQHRRGTDAEQWPDWDGAERQEAARARVRALHPELSVASFPTLPRKWSQPFEPVSLTPPFASPLAKSKPRLLLIVAWADLGGTDRFNLDLLDELAERGWEVSVATTLASPDRWREEYLRRTPDLFLLHRFLRPPDYPRFLRYLVESRRPDVVLVSHSELAYQLLPALRAWCPEPAYVDYLHIVEPDWKSGGYPRHSLLAQPQLDRTVASSRQVAEWMIERGAEPQRLGVVYIGTDATRFRPDAGRRRRVRAELALRTDTPIILFAGRLCAQKRPLFAARVLAEIASRGVEFVGLVAGDGEDRETLEAFAVENQLGERLRLLGARTSAEIADLMAASDVFLLPSEREGIAASIFEAMASGMAIVASDVGGQRELVGEANGVLLPPGETEDDVARFADRLVELLADPARRTELGRAARRRIEEGFVVKRMGDAMVRELEAARRAERRPPIPRQLADRWAEQMVEFQRLSALCDWMWRERQTASPTAPATSGGPETPTAGERLFALGKRLLEPSYVWAVRRGWSWLPALKERCKRRLISARDRPADGLDMGARRTGLDSAP